MRVMKVSIENDLYAKAAAGGKKELLLIKNLINNYLRGSKKKWLLAGNVNNFFALNNPKEVQHIRISH